MLYGIDTSGNIVNSGQTLSCGSIPFHINVANTSNIATPCISSQYAISLLDAGFCSNTTETFYEGGTDLLCVGPSASCVYPVGGGGPCPNGSIWAINKIYLDPNQQHNFDFSYSSLLGGSTVQLVDCWIGTTTLSPVGTFSLLTVGTHTFTDIVPAGTDIGTAIFTIAPASYSIALTDYHNGKSLINPALLAAGNYTVTYTFIPPAASCPSTTVTGTFNFSIAPGFTVSVNSATVCAGSLAILTASGGPSPTSYSWSPATGLNTTTGSTVAATPSVISIYTVMGTHSGCSATATSTVTVNPTPTVTVNNATICRGTTATLTANGAATYSWTPATGLSSTSTSVVIASPTVTTTYTIIGTSGGCTSFTTSTVTINPTPTVTVTVNSATICTGNSATLTASGANTYTWNTSATGATISPSPTVTTNYTVTGTDINNCKNTATSTLTVNPLPVITVNNATICIGATTTLTANGATNYTWSPSSGLPTNNTVTASPLTTTVYTVTGTTGSCLGTTTCMVTVNPLPTITINSPTICKGNTATLTANGANTYTWNTSATGPTITSSPTVTTNYTVAGTDIHNCKNTATSTVTVNPLPIITVNNATVCRGSSATLTASGANTYTWNTSAISPTITPSPTVNTTYTVTGTNANNCRNTATSAVVVNPLPTITVNNATICKGTSATLTANGANTYIWNTSTTGATISPSPTITTNYTITGTDMNGCVNSTVAIVNVKPTPTVAATGSSSVCVGQPIKLFGNAISGATYQWNGPNGFTASSHTATITNATELNVGTYTLSITLSGCSATNTIAVSVDSMPTIAHAGIDTTIYNSSISLNGNVPLIGSGIWSVFSGSGTFVNNNSANTQVSNLQTGQNILQWTISNGACPVSFDDVIITVEALIIPNGFSPNGDATNDYFEIRGLEDYNNVKLNVFNRWGNEVYESTDYKNDWSGKNMSGENLSDDTYFYTLEIPNKNTFKGFVVLKRK